MLNLSAVSLERQPWVAIPTAANSDGVTYIKRYSGPWNARHQQFARNPRDANAAKRFYEASFQTSVPDHFMWNLI